MRLEIAERMRCPRPHAPTPLIVVALETADRELVRGVGGCPACHLEMRVEGGDALFPGAAPDAPRRAAAPSRAAEDALLARVVALLGIAEPGGAVLLTGRYAALAAALAAQCDVAVIVLNAESAVGSGVSRAYVAESSVPFTDGTFRAAALDLTVPASTAHDAVRVVAVGGRVLGASALAVPPGLRELARDSAEWVAERESGPSGFVPLARA
jgi:hypothetical protein